MYRVLVPGGRLALLVWGAIEHCPGYSVLTEALERYIGQASAAIMRAPFSLGDAQQVRALIAGAQFRQVHIRTSVGTVRFASSEDFVQHQVSGSPLAGPVSQADDNARSALLHEVSTALQPYMSRDGLAFPIEAHLVTGRR
jgi:hypothetical protein